MLLLIDLLYILVVLVVGPFWLVRRIIRRRPMPPLGARLGFVRRRPVGAQRTWVHGVSVGEVLAARGLIQALRAQGQDVLVTSTTVLGLATAAREYGPECVEPCPLDFSFAVRRFMDRTQPTALVLMELELWPNILTLAGRRGLPVVCVNAKLSLRSQRGWQRIQSIAPRLLEPLKRIAVQNSLYQQRFLMLGLGSERVRVCGDLKADNASFRDATAERQRWRELLQCDASEQVLVAGSTHDGEEEILLEAWDRLQRSGQRARLILAPRHLERLAHVRALAEKYGRVVLLGELPSVESSPIILVDRLGQLASLYAAADLAFVGGSLVPVGGHNLLEPAAVGVPILTGPHVATVANIADELEAAGVLQRVQLSTSPECERMIHQCLSDASLRERAQSGAREVIAAHAGALQRTLVFIGDLLTEPRKESVSHV
jgi:3-deoxy-D-manno-octulosonic-acid transferase